MIIYTNSINIPTLIYHIVSYHLKFVFEKEQEPNMHIMVMLLIVCCLLAQVYIRIRQNDGRIISAKTNFE